MGREPRCADISRPLLEHINSTNTAGHPPEVVNKKMPSERSNVPGRGRTTRIFDVIKINHTSCKMQADRVRHVCGGAVMSWWKPTEEEAAATAAIYAPYAEYRYTDDVQSETPTDDAADQAEAAKPEVRANSNVVISMAGAKATLRPKPAPKLTADDRDLLHVKLGKAVLNVIRDRGDD